MPRKSFRKQHRKTRKQHRKTYRRRYQRKQKGGYIQLLDPEYETDSQRITNKVTYSVDMPGINFPPNYEFFFRIVQTPNYISQVKPEEPPHSCMFESFFVDKSNPTIELGHFSLHGLSYFSPSRPAQRCDIFSSGYPVSMGIGISENIRGGGISRILIYIVTQAILQLYPSVAENPSIINLYIDTDASAGFWERIGMKPSKVYEREYEGQYKPLVAGYEKYIDFQKLTNFGLGY